MKILKIAFIHILLFKMPRGIINYSLDYIHSIRKFLKEIEKYILYYCNMHEIQMAYTQTPVFRCLFLYFYYKVLKST